MSNYLITSMPSSDLEKPENKEIKGLIMAQWLRTFKHGSIPMRKVPPAHYWKEFHAYIENLLKKPDSIVRLALLSDDKDVVLGFSVFREDVLDYVFVKTDMRRNGIGKALLPENITAFTFLTDLAFKLWTQKPQFKSFEYKPRA